MRIPLLCLMLLLIVATCSHAAETRGLTVVAKDQATGQQGEVKLYNKSYAVIIGIDKYANLPPDRQLSYAVRDAQGIEQVLRKQFKFDKVVTLYNEQATRNRIVRLLTSELPKEMGSEDSLFIFWAGHGNQEQTPDGDIGYLIPYDGSLDDISSAVTMSEIRDTISRKIPAKHVFYAMDACYSGLLTTRAVDPKVRRDLGYLREITKERVRQVLTAGSKGQEVLDGGPKGHSVFTGRLIEVLEATGDFITANEIQAILKEKVYGDAKGRGFTQTPAFGALSGSGDFVFVPNLEQKVADNRTAMAELERELKTLETREVEARTQEDAQKRRELEAQRLVAEAKLKAEQLRQRQLQDEQRRHIEDEQSQLRLSAEERKREQELVAARTVEEQRLSILKAEVEKRRQGSGATSLNTSTIEAAISDIKRLNSQIDAIEAAYRKEQQEGILWITTRYEAEIQKQKLVKPQSLRRDEFETEEEFTLRSEKTSPKAYIAVLEQKKREEIALLEKRIADEQAGQTAVLRDTIKSLEGKEYTLGTESLTLELGPYNVTKQSFPVSISSKIPSFKLAFTGVLPLSRDAARKFKQQYLAGLVRPEATIKAGMGEVVRVAAANDADNSLMTYENGEFLTNAEERRREEERLALIYTDLASGLQWVRDGNLAGKQMNWDEAMAWAKQLDYAGYHDWRLPTKEELEIFAKKGGGHPVDYFNSNGFSNTQLSGYWSSTAYARDPKNAWSSTAYARDPKNAWAVYFDDGYVGSPNKDSYYYVRCVRGGQ